MRFDGSIIERCVRFEGSGVRVDGSGNGDAWRCDGGNDDIKRYDGSGEWMLLSVVTIGDTSEKRLPFSGAARTFGVAGYRE